MTTTEPAEHRPGAHHPRVPSPETSPYVTFFELPDLGVPRWSRKHVIDLVKAGKFVAPRQLSDNRIGWLKSDVLHWVHSRPIANIATGADAPNRRAPGRPRQDAAVGEPAGDGEADDAA